jgi:hypothetical protein
VFRRKSESEPAPSEQDKPDGKGRPTPKRKEAEAAARARARPARTRKEQAQRQRQARVESSRKVRQAMKTGDERYLLPRDKGPVRRFTRDYVDSRLSILEMLIPVMIVVLMAQLTGRQDAYTIANVLMLGTLALAVMEIFLLRFRLRRELRQRFPDESYRGTTFYAVTRAVNLRFMRMPKPKVRLGQSLSDDYR